MNSNILTFLYGLLLLILFGWYFATDSGQRKRILGTVLTVLLVAFCIQSAYPPSKKVQLGLDLQGGTSFLIQLDVPKGEVLTEDSVNQAVEVIRKRVDAFGVSEPVITPEGLNRIVVQIPGLDEAKIADVREQLQKVAKLEFRLVRPDSEQLLSEIDKGEQPIPPGYEIREEDQMDKDGHPVLGKDGKPEVAARFLVTKTADMGGEHVIRANAFYTTEYGVSLTMDNVGKDLFGKLTAQAYQNHTELAILLDGVVICAPGVREGPIYDGVAQITGNFDETSARNLSSDLENPLRTPVHIEQEDTVSSTLGLDSIRSGVYAGVAGLVLVLLFVIAYYQFAGLVAVFGLLVNVILLFGIMCMFHFVLTLPGIAGIILTIGLAVDANVLIYERLREEMTAGKALGAAIEAAYNKAFTVIFDANVTTLITAAILFWKSSGPVKGFAVTLMVGIIASVFSAMIVTRTVFSWAMKGGWIKRITMLHLINPAKQINFMAKRRLWISISLTVIIVSIVGFAMRGEKNFGIDFLGGDMLTVSSTQPVSEGEARAALSSLGFEEVIQKSHSTTSAVQDFLVIRSPTNTYQKILQTLQQKLPQAGIKEMGHSSIGSAVGKELAQTSLWAFGLAVLGIVVYVTLRFEFSFAVGAIVALIHDVVITVGVFAICGHELSLIMVGAILTIAGYSINDTIVVYDRIREGLHSRRSGSVQEIMNASINETLSRTLLTSGCTLLSVLSLFLFGGSVLRDFAFAILIGVVVGTYSSIFIASPIVLWWSRRGAGLHAEVKGKGQPPIGGRLANS
ncbi:MAG TPA: protein translocase subunit SecD [Chthoniobacteraceae bacterium]|jgi:SecD/SecF fusion protein|nr:protein translocase subunit SecD [Chthoniobacteraceae bacterium]